MLLVLLLARLTRPRRFVWKPELDLTDHVIRATLHPGAHS
jgi:hypothetical protein